MILAGMIRTDENALICDLAETYGVLDYRALPLKTVAALSCGLRETSRIRMKLAGREIDTTTMLLAAAVDRLSILAWMQTKDGAKNRRRPESILGKLTGKTNGKENIMKDVVVFRSPEEFEAARARILKGG